MYIISVSYTHLDVYKRQDVYLPPFEAVAKAGAATFMTSFNDNDGEMCIRDRDHIQ